MMFVVKLQYCNLNRPDWFFKDVICTKAQFLTKLTRALYFCMTLVIFRELSKGFFYFRQLWLFSVS